ncbi:MAG: hypothetical protein AB7G28_24275 [Pirellulales bacterium]
MEQSDLLKYAATLLHRLGINYAVVGSFASSVWGESRLTQDIDIVVDLKPTHVANICAAFPDPEFYVSASAAQEAVANSSQFNVINPSSGNKIDFLVSGEVSWVLAQLDRAKRLSIFAEVDVQIAAPEDVILGKLIDYREGGSEKHLRDIAGILKTSAAMIDRQYIT